ncbi:MAG TPA: protein kinase [Longimicrobiaceae bacterium]|nr:protein kinase [Longimicrobiaceae bacterium]
MTHPFGRALVGRTLAGRYELEEVIGSGGMSVVFRGRDGTLGRAVAVKVVSLPADSDEARENLRERLRREAASAARIPPHPNVVQIFDYGTDAELDLDFIVMELLRGRDLKHALAEGPLPPGEALRVLREAAQGLAAGHRVGIVHRDVKPANVFLAEDGEPGSVRLLDFGIAKPLEDDGADTITTLGQLPHSPAYASPEQLDPEVPLAPASDVYQLGLIGYETLTGERPFSEQERVRIRGGEDVPLVATPRWSTVPAAVRAVIARALGRDPAHRYADAGEFGEALADAEDAEDGTVLQAPAPSDHTMVMPAATAAAPALPPARSRVAAGRAAAGIARRRSPALLAIPLVVVAALALWAASQRGGEAESPAVVTPVPADTGDFAALEEEFLGLQGAASGALASGALTDSARAPLPSPVPPPAGDESLLEAEGRERGEAAEVQRAVADANQAWVAGDLTRHVSHYADRVDYYSAEGVTRDFVRQDRAKDLAKYDEREITIRRQAVAFRPDGRAMDLVDKTWTFAGSGERWTGSMRVQLILEKRSGRWVIVSERSSNVDYSRKERI